MVDNIADPQLVGEQPRSTGSLTEAQDAILGLMDSIENPKKEEEQASPSEEVAEDVSEETSSEKAEEEVEASEEEALEDEESEESFEEEAEDESEETTLYTVTVDGEEQEVSEEELVKGYSRQADYTRKTQQLAEHRKQIDQVVQSYKDEIAQTQQARDQYVNAVAQAIETNYSHLQQFQNIDWERLKVEDREEYLTKRDEYRQAQDHIQSLQQAQSKAQQEAQAESEKEHQRLIQEEHQRMVKVIPDWADTGKRQAMAKAVSEFALSVGYTQEELNQLVDHRSIIVLMQAKAYADMQKKQTTVRSKKVKNKPKVVRSKAKADKADNDKVKRTKQMKRLKQTGKPEDAASLFMDYVEL
tara:strand:- start:1332 stop:2405 length:1074 start_codon:yes stop_codon:yes gene_type:complete